MPEIQQLIREFEKAGELIRISKPVNPGLEITEITDRISKQQGGGKALLFENTGTDFPVLINALGSEKRIAMAFGRESIYDIEKEIEALFLHLMEPKGNLWDKLRLLPKLKEVSAWMPKKLKSRGKCQEVRMETPDLNKLPVLTCWPADGGPFITLPGVHTLDPETKSPNLGMYRLQVFEKDLTGMHWHKHKTGASHFEKYKKRGQKMPVSVALGGDLVYTYAATAPMPENVDEYLLAGFLRKKPVRLVKCLTNDLYVPEDADFVIEGYVDPEEELIWEGPFGDHTGFYSLADWYPKFHVTCITHKKGAVYPATIVGIPPMEDAYIGKATERIFLTPIRLSMVPELKDMELPFAGVAHNLTIVKIGKSYPGQAIKVMHSLWGAGQMMFNKILLVVEEDVNVHDYRALAKVFAENFNPEYSLHFTKGPLDVLDHSSQKFAFGSKLGIDLTTPLPEEISETKKAVQQSMFTTDSVEGIKSISSQLDMEKKERIPVLLLNVRKNSEYDKAGLQQSLERIQGIDKFKAVLIFDEGTPLSDLFALVWLVGGNLEPHRDVTVLKLKNSNKVVLIDATIKTDIHDKFQRDWPNIVTMDDKTITQVDKRWNELGLGEFIKSPSLKYKTLVKGAGAVRET